MHPFDDREVARAALEPTDDRDDLAEIAEVVGGTAWTATPDRRRAGAFIDTRTPEPGGLFVAFVGERVDGHDYAARR